MNFPFILIFSQSGEEVSTIRSLWCARSLIFVRTLSLGCIWLRETLGHSDIGSAVRGRATRLMLRRITPRSCRDFLRGAFIISINVVKQNISITLLRFHDGNIWVLTIILETFLLWIAWDPFFQYYYYQNQSNN